MQGRERYGRWALVAGASEGLGAAFAEALARRGHDLLLIARRAEVLETLAATLRAKYPVEVVTAAVDLSSSELATQLAAVTSDREVGVLVCNAASAPLGPFMRQTVAETARAVDVNCRSPLALLHLLLPAMVDRGRGAVVLMSSLTAFQGSPFASVYGATKAFNLALAEGLWAELKPHGVQVIASCAGATRTPNYLKTMAKGGAPGELEPRQVAEETLAQLANGPLVIPGTFNRFASFLMRRLLPRRVTVNLMASQTRKLQLPP
jgi:short-subunit dehydrogenase